MGVIRAELEAVIRLVIDEFERKVDVITTADIANDVSIPEEAVWRLLPPAKKLIEKKYEDKYLIHLINQNYFDLYLNEQIEIDRDLAARCLPPGGRLRTIGIRRALSKNDLLYDESVRKGFACAAGKTKKNLVRTVGGVMRRVISEKRGASLIVENRERSVPFLGDTRDDQRRKMKLQALLQLAKG